MVVNEVVAVIGHNEDLSVGVDIVNETVALEYVRVAIQQEVLDAQAEKSVLVVERKAPFPALVERKGTFPVVVKKQGNEGVGMIHNEEQEMVATPQELLEMVYIPVERKVSFPVVMESWVFPAEKSVLVVEWKVSFPVVMER